MTTTKSILNVLETPTTVEVPFLARTDLEEISSTISADGNDREKVYQYTGGDEDYPMSLRIAVYRKPAANGGIGEVVLTSKISTFAREVDDTSSETLWVGPASVSITTRVPGASAVVDSADFLALVANAYTAFFATVDGSNIPETAVVDKLKYNVPSIS